MRVIDGRGIGRRLAAGPLLGKHGDEGQKRQMRHLLALAALTVATAAAAQGSGNAEVRAAAHAFDVARQTGDRATLERMIAPDFLFVRASGRIGTKQDFIDGFTGPGQKLEPFRIEDPLFVRVSDDVAIVGGEAWVKGIDDGRPFAEHFRYADTFARREGRWTVVYVQVTGLAPD